MESSSVRALRRRNENHTEYTRSDSDTLRENRNAIRVRLVHDWNDTGGIRLRRKKEIEGENIFLMTSMRNLMTQDGAAVA